MISVHLIITKILQTRFIFAIKLKVLEKNIACESFTILNPLQFIQFAAVGTPTRSRSLKERSEIRVTRFVFFSNRYNYMV